MVKKEMPILTGPPEFEKETRKVQFPSNINGDIQNKVLDKLQLVKNADLSGDMDESEVLQNIDNQGELMEEIQTRLIDFAVKYMTDVETGESIDKHNLTPEAYDIILSQYTSSLKGVEVKKKLRSEASNYIRRCAEQSNPPTVNSSVLRAGIRYKGLMDAGFTIKPSDVPAPIMQAILLLENEKNEYKKKQQDKIERKMRMQQHG